MTKTNRNALTFVAASTLAVAIAGASAQAVQAESLRDAIAMAYAQNPTLMRQRAEQRATDENYVQARSGMGPSVGAGLSDNYSRAPSALGGTVSTVTGSISLNQTLFTSGNLASQLSAADATVKSGRESLRSVEQGVLLDVISAYTAVRRDQAALQISQDNYNALKQQLNQTQAQFEAGQLTRTDVAQSQARLSQSEASLAQAQARLDTDRATYVQVVGQAPTQLEAEPDLPGLPADFNSALATAENSNPDLAAASYAAAAAHARVGEARSSFGPQVSLSAATDQVALANHLGTSVNESSATLRLSIPLYASGLNSSRLRQALEDENAQRATVDITRRQVTAGVAQAWSQMLAARSATASNQSQVKAAQIAFDGVKTEQQVGLRTNIEVLNAEQELESAQLALVDAQRQQYVAAAQLLQVTGALTAQSLVPNVELYDPVKNFNRVRNKGWNPVEPVVHALDSLAAGDK